MYSHPPANSYTVTPDLLIDGYISQSFRPNNEAESYLCYLLKTTRPGLRQLSLAMPGPHGSGPRVIFVTKAAQNAFAPMPLTQDRSGYPLWLLDYSVVRIGTVVPQSLWSPNNVNDLRHHVTDAKLELPIFFTREDGVLGLSLNDAAKGRCHTLRDGRAHAYLGGKSTTYIRILWPGYDHYRRQIQLRDETLAKNPITVAKFAQHVARSVEAFMNARTPSQTRTEDDDRWIIGRNGIDPPNIILIGVVQVSAGSWMPILQLNNVYIM